MPLDSLSLPERDLFLVILVGEVVPPLPSMVSRASDAVSTGGRIPLALLELVVLVVAAEVAGGMLDEGRRGGVPPLAPPLPILGGGGGVKVVLALLVTRSIKSVPDSEPSVHSSPLTTD